MGGHALGRIASRKSRPGEPLLISKVIPGSVASRCGSISPGDILLAVNGVSLEACSITDAARLLQTSEDIVTLRIQKPDEEAATPLSDEDLLSCCQSDLEIVRDDDNDFGSGGGGGVDASNEIQDDEFLSQSADESISHLLPPPRMPRRNRSQKPKRTQHRRMGTVPMNLRMQQQFQQLESEIGSDRRGNPSDSLSSDRFSENICSERCWVQTKSSAHTQCPSPSTLKSFCLFRSRTTAQWMVGALGSRLCLRLRLRLFSGSNREDHSVKSSSSPPTPPSFQIWGTIATTCIFDLEIRHLKKYRGNH
ncbi:Glutamate receptor-interacting protein 2 [Taenia solium]|eukprot:TsM_001223300 transcript=TsM_001223300 gene=TsM_001223300